MQATVKPVYLEEQERAVKPVYLEEQERAVKLISFVIQQRTEWNQEFDVYMYSNGYELDDTWSSRPKIDELNSTIGAELADTESFDCNVILSRSSGKKTALIDSFNTSDDDEAYSAILGVEFQYDRNYEVYCCETTESYVRSDLNGTDIYTRFWALKLESMENKV